MRKNHIKLNHKKALASLYEPISKIVNPPMILSRLDSLKQIELYLNNKRPQTLIITLDKHLNVLDTHGKILASLNEFLTLLDNQFILAVETEDLSIAKAFIKAMELLNWYEFFIISMNQDILLTCKNKNGYSNLILKITDINTLDFNEIRINKLLLPIEQLTKALISSLQYKTFFTLTETNTLIEREKALLSGINGIITNHPLRLIDRYESFKIPTHIRDIHFVAHRGLHNGYKYSRSPENTLQTALHVVDAGVKTVEIDIHLTKDNEVVVIHDEKTNRLTKEKYEISKTTYQILKNIPLKQTYNQVDVSTIKTLKDFLNPFKEKSVHFYIETKVLSKELIKRTAIILASLKMIDRVTMISFHYKNILWQQTYLPTINNGFLYGKSLSKNDDTLAQMIWFLIPLKATYNPNYSTVTEDMVRQLNYRGIGVYPWTADGVNDIFKIYNMGVAGITTNTYDDIKDALIYIDISPTYEFIINQDPLTILIDNTSLSGIKKTMQSELILVDDGQTNISFEHNQIMAATNPGEAYFYFDVKLNLLDGSIIHKTTQLFKVIVKAN